MISKIWLIQKSDGEFIDYVYTTKQLAECRTRHQQDGATLTIQEWVLADRPAPSDEAPDPREWLIHGGGGHEGGAGGLRSLTVSGGGLIDFLESYRDAIRGEAPAAKASGRAKADAQATFDALKKSREPHAPDMRTVDSEGFIESAPQAGEDDLIWARHYLRDGGPHDAAESTEEAAKLLAAERAAERNRAIEDTEKLRADLKEAQAGEDTPIRVKREWGSRRVIKRAIDWFRAHPGESWENLPPATLSLYFWLNDVWSDGFEAAHALRKCGHSVGDYRDSNYIPGKPSTYKAQESCVGCADRDRARREALEEAANVRVPNTRFGGTNGLDVAEQEAIRALATRTEAPMAPEGKGTTK